MPDRTINWGSSEADATYQTGDADPAGGGNFVVAEDTDAGTVLLEWDATAGEWVSRGPVEMSGNDVTNVGALDAGSVGAEVSRTESRTVTLNVPADYSTAGAALAEIADLRPAPGLQIEINIESGHTWQDTFEVENQDLRHVTITSEDAVVNADGDHPGGNGLVLVNCAGPRWNLMLDGQGLVNRGIVPREGTNMTITSGSGATNCERGMEATRSCQIYAEGADFSNNSDRGMSITRSCVVFAGDGTFAGNGNRNVRVGGASVVNVTGADLSNSTSGEGLFVSNHSYVSARLATLSGNGNSRGVECMRGFVDVSGADINNNETGIDLHDGGTIVATNATIDGNTSTGAIVDSGTIGLNGATVTNNDFAGLRLFGSTGRFRGGQADNGGEDIELGEGSTISIDGTPTTTSSGSDPHEGDMNLTPNTVNGEGIIFAESTETA